MVINITDEEILLIDKEILCVITSIKFLPVHNTHELSVSFSKSELLKRMTIKRKIIVYLEKSYCH